MKRRGLVSGTAASGYLTEPVLVIGTIGVHQTVPNVEVKAISRLLNLAIGRGDERLKTPNVWRDLWWWAEHQ